MLDHPEKTARLLADLKAAAPFEAELARPVFEHLQSENVVEANRGHHTVWDLSYGGDEGGILCHLSRSEETGTALVVSLTMCVCTLRCHLQRLFSHTKSIE